MDRIVVRKDTYFDSVFLMSISAELGKVEGVDVGQVVLATPANTELIAGQGFDPAQLAGLGPTDLVIALRAASPGILDAAEKRLQELLGRRHQSEGTSEAKPVGLDGALRSMTDANLVVISVPGAYAAYEARRALAAGLHVMMFSDNVTVDDEIALKTEAIRRGKLLMGPDCGTAIINGVMLGFANAVRRGGIGVVGASGTGTQEVTCLVHQFGAGISQAIGTGGRDLSEAVGARTTLFAIDALAADADTKVIVVVSKPPARAVADRVLARLGELDKPVVVHFVGANRSGREGNVHHTPDLERAARAAVALANGKPVETSPAALPAALLKNMREGKMAPKPVLRGLFTGGTMAAEALATFRKEGFEVVSNLDHGDAPSEASPTDHAILDLGGDEYTQGRPHPMIDPTPRVERLMRDADNEHLSIVLLDVVLGTGSHADPAGAMVPSILHAMKRASERGSRVRVVASVTGTDGDTQGLDDQIEKLERAGVAVLPSNIQAVRFAHALLTEADHG